VYDCIVIRETEDRIPRVYDCIVIWAIQERVPSVYDCIVIQETEERDFYACTTVSSIKQNKIKNRDVPVGLFPPVTQLPAGNIGTS